MTQADHARLAADLLRLFRLPELLEHPRRELLLRAVAEHDNGWWEADAAPRRDAKGATALDFRDLAADLRREIWLRGVERYAAESPYLAALLATHCLRLLRPWVADPAWESFRAQLLERRQELLATAGESPAAPVYIDGEKAMTLRGDNIAAEFTRIVDEYVERKFKKRD